MKVSPYKDQGGYSIKITRATSLKGYVAKHALCDCRIKALPFSSHSNPSSNQPGIMAGHCLCHMVFKSNDSFLGRHQVEYGPKYTGHFSVMSEPQITRIWDCILLVDSRPQFKVTS